jgi:hypothetical protein
VHHDRRLHQMMLAEDCRAWDARHAGGCDASRRASLDSSSSCASSFTAAAAQPPQPARSVCSACRASPTDSASSLHADCSAAAKDDDAASALYRRAIFHSSPTGLPWVPRGCRVQKKDGL